MGSMICGVAFTGNPASPNAAKSHQKEPDRLDVKKEALYDNLANRALDRC